MDAYWEACLQKHISEWFAEARRMTQSDKNTDPNIDRDADAHRRKTRTHTDGAI